jgi:hypothetical protein
MEDDFLTCWRCRLKVARICLRACEDDLEEERSGCCSMVCDDCTKVLRRIWAGMLWRDVC